MSHVDDGSLHAYLDGQLSAVEQAKLETHLGECAACRARLDEERALIERAGQLLGLATPPGPERAMPPLHQLRHPRPRLRGMVPLAWAATVVLAVWVGWSARGGRSAPETRTALEAPADSTMYYLRDPRMATPPPANATRSPREQPPVTPEGRVAARDEGERDDRAAGALASRADNVVRAEPAAAAGAPAAPAPLPQALDVGTVVTAAEPKMTISPDSARRVLGGSLVLVPGLAVKAIRYQPGGPVEIDQQLDSATAITLYEWPAEPPAQRRQQVSERAAAPTAAAPSAPSANVAKTSGYTSERLARYVRGVRVEIAGKVPVDSLNKLLERVR